MIPMLFEADETSFQSNGLGALTDTVSCFIDQEINGGFELEMRYSAEGIHFELLRKNRIILAETGSAGQPQPFRIYRISKEIGGTVMVYARHICYDLMGIPVAPFSAENAREAMGKIRENAVVPCPFELAAEIDAEGSMEAADPKDAWTLIGKSGILSAYTGELEFNRFSVKLKDHLGENRGAALRYGKNLYAFGQDENCGDVFTGIFPYWKSKDGALTTLPEKTVSAAGSFDHVKIKSVDFSAYFDSAPTAEQLREKAADYVQKNGIGIPEVSITLGYVQLSRTMEYPDALPEKITLGDAVTVVFEKMLVTTTARVIKTRYNVLSGRHESVSIGKVKRTISDTISKQSKGSGILSGRVSSSEKKIEDVDKKADGIRMATNQCIADIGDVTAGLYSIATADDIKGLKEANTTLFAKTEEEYAGLELHVQDNDEEIEGLKESSAKLETRVSGAETALEMVSRDVGDLQEASAEISARVDLAEESIEGKAGKQELQAGLSTKVSNKDLTDKLKNYALASALGDYLTVNSAAEMYVTSDGVTSIIGNYIVTDKDGTKKSLAQILADQVSVMSKVNNTTSGLDTKVSNTDL
ncbi:MAG: phage tail spike protein, partial [Elusimicrobiales bacterium]|nr:phage tail spike protein [Elusimicrobiales bacterium]